ncbi:MAG: hypothetical protein A2Y62_18230 [Candidatus Fischerbacteria bacterium RBG_13_37_8]|uniref:Uncharacterized protein n=1 Tax=Candidatus Fischerbacteria bacterium RBG_13_37_8 TaxID=1817863 RepID=A0A1F5VVY9_9BACT|nr:MAG: hypothetical protein A2Y62_18230 [Candidatus Fischerbacteria bacterium RBG_13_37_8]
MCKATYFFSRGFMMKHIIYFIGIMLVLGYVVTAISQEQTPKEEKNFFENSLHYTNRGLDYWYGKQQGGLERLTNIPTTQLNCKKCHVASCDACHVKKVGEKSEYSIEPAATQKECIKCHGKGDMEKTIQEGNAVDIHFERGMKCMDCHTVREIHGDGTLYNSMQQSGSMDAKCENCHTRLTEIESHTVHGGKIDCVACHTKEANACYNCHFDTRVKENKSASLPLKNIFFLINHKGKITLANIHTFVYQNKTMIVFAPIFPHTTTREGKKCEDCHNATLFKDIKRNKFRAITFENGELLSYAGVVPVLDGMKWNFVYLNYENEQWIPIENPPEPLINYAGYSSPLTADQFIKMEKAVPPKKK